MPTPTGLKVEVEFVAGTWTDVTADLDYSAGVSVTVGRTSPTQAPQTSSMSVALRNPTGKYTPALQVLTDGTAAPYYPNVIPRRRIRFSNSAGVRFLGYVQSWAPLLDNGFTGRCQVQAVDRMDQLARVTMQTPIRQEIVSDDPTFYWPLTDDASSTTAYEAIGGRYSLSIAQSGAGGTVTFGDNGPGSGEGTGVKLAPASTVNGRYLSSASLPGLNSVTPIAVYVQMAAAPAATVALISIDEGAGNFVTNVTVDTSGHVTYFSGALGTIVGTTSITDGAWHEIEVTITNVGPTFTAQLWVDGVSAGTAGSGIGGVMAPAVLRVGQAALSSGGSAIPTANFGQVALGLNTPGGVINRAAARNAFAGETVNARIARFLGYAGLTSGDWTLDASTVAMGGYPQGDKDVLAACQDMTVTEGAGSVFYVLAGSARFTNRKYRQPGSPVLTIDASLDASRDNYQPGVDSQTLVNSVTAERMTASGSASSQTVTDAASVATNGVYTGSAVSSYATTDSDVLHNAQQIVAANRTPGFRLPQVQLDLLTATTSKYAAAQAVQIGSRIRVTSIPAGAAPATQLDLIVEGWTETANINSYSIKYDTSPADNPAIGVFDTARAQASGQTLNAAITAAATTVAIATAAGLPTFTTTPAQYPMTVVVGGEHIRLNSAPGGSASPQTFTGVTRGVDGTPAAAQASAAPVALSPTTTYAL